VITTCEQARAARAEVTTQRGSGGKGVPLDGGAVVSLLVQLRERTRTMAPRFREAEEKRLAKISEDLPQSIKDLLKKMDELNTKLETKVDKGELKEAVIASEKRTFANMEILAERIDDDRAENRAKHKKTANMQEKLKEEQERQAKVLEALAEEQKRQTNQRDQDRTEYTTALGHVVDAVEAVTPPPKPGSNRQHKAKGPTLEPTAPKRQRTAKALSAEETAARDAAKKAADDKKAETKRKADERAVAKAAAKKATDDKKAAALNKQKAKIEEQLAQLTAPAV
jgi:hypothetical protein